MYQIKYHLLIYKGYSNAIASWILFIQTMVQLWLIGKQAMNFPLLHLPLEIAPFAFIFTLGFGHVISFISLLKLW